MKRQKENLSLKGFVVEVQVEVHDSITLRASAPPTGKRFFEKTVEEQSDLLEIFQRFLRKEGVTTDRQGYFTLEVSYCIQGQRGSTVYQVCPDKREMQSPGSRFSLRLLEQVWEQAGGVCTSYRP